MIQAAIITWTGLAKIALIGAGIGIAIFGVLVLGVARNPSLRSKLFLYSNLIFLLFESIVSFVLIKTFLVTGIREKLVVLCLKFVTTNYLLHLDVCKKKLNTLFYTIQNLFRTYYIIFIAVKQLSPILFFLTSLFYLFLFISICLINELLIYALFILFNLSGLALIYPTLIDTR